MTKETAVDGAMSLLHLRRDDAKELIDSLWPEYETPIQEIENLIELRQKGKNERITSN